MTVEEQVADLRERMAGVEATLGAHQRASEDRASGLADKIGAVGKRLDKIEDTLETLRGYALRFALGAALSAGGVSGLVSYAVEALSGDAAPVSVPDAP